MGSVRVRAAQARDAPAMAQVHVRAWQETYRGLMSDDVLDDPGFLAARERFWTGALSDPRYAANRVAVAEHGTTVVGIAMAGPVQDGEATSGVVQLFVLYLLAAHHGGGAGPALLEAVIEPGRAVTLWVADPNPRAQAFYRRHGFQPDGTSKVEAGVREIRMVRAASEPCAGGGPQSDRCSGLRNVEDAPPSSAHPRLSG